jgi:hypothetical protein
LPAKSRSQLLLLLFALEPSYTRQELVDLLWPGDQVEDSDDLERRRVNNNLDQALGAARKALGPASTRLRSRRRAVSLPRGPDETSGTYVSSDVDEFYTVAASTDAGDLFRAIELTRGQLAAHFPQPGGVDFRWLIEARDRQFRALRGVLERLFPDQESSALARDVLQGGASRLLATAGARSTDRRPSPETQRPRILAGSSMPGTRGHLFGRKSELALLDQAWDDPDTHILSLVAWGGVGKSALLNAWLARMAKDNYRGAETVFIWSFYTQGTSQRVVSADLFIESALHNFGDLEPLASRGHWQRGERLAQLVRQERTLLVLDGLEPLQVPPGRTDEGRLRDNALAVLLSELAAANRGLCLISTRLPIANLGHHETSTAPRHDLNHLTPDAGAKLLTAMGVQGDIRELEQSSTEFGGHALALTLLGSYLDEAYGGDIRRRRDVKPLESESRYGGHATRVLTSYEEWLGEGPELELLYLLGLFDRPAARETIDAVISGVPLAGLTEHLVVLNRRQWHQLLGRLSRLELIIGDARSDWDPLDAHPLVREHFGTALRNKVSAVWKTANARLFDYYSRSTIDRPATVEEMEPLFLAVISACHAGLHEQAWREVYKPRIMRGDERYASAALGAHGALLHVLSHFVVNLNWREPHPALVPEDALEVLLDAGIHLTATRGYAAPEVEDCYATAERLAEELHDTQSLLAIRLAQCRLYRVRGDLRRSLGVAEAIDDALHGAATDRRVVAERALASTLFYLGRFARTERHAASGRINYPSATALANAELDLNEPAISCAGYLALAKCLQGEPTPAVDIARDAVYEARSLGHGHTIVVSQLMLAMVHQFRGDLESVSREGSALARRCEVEGFALWRLSGEILAAWAQGRLAPGSGAVERISRCIEQWSSLGARLFLPYWYGLLADAIWSGAPDQAVTLPDRPQRALAVIDRGLLAASTTGEVWWEPELRRLRGLAVQPADDYASATDELKTGIAVAKSQGALLPELRLRTALYELARHTSHGEEIARNDLEAVLGRFSDEESAPDLRYATALLDAS